MSIFKSRFVEISVDSLIYSKVVMNPAPTFGFNPDLSKKRLIPTLVAIFATGLI